LVELEPTPSRRGVFGLLHCDTFEKGTQLLVGIPPLRSRWFGHHSEEDCRGGKVLARPVEEWWMIIAVIVIDAAVDVMGSSSSYAAIVVTPEVLFECLA
jgi:hypothetical protein